MKKCECKIRAWVAVLIATLVAGCAEPEILQPHGAAAPAGVDFSGFWTLRADKSGNQRRLREAIDRTDGIDNYRPSSATGQSSRSGRAKGGIVQVFLKVGSALKVTQTPYALFISFDRSVVEEFRFGENRAINIGAAEAMRVSGWNGNAYVVETLDKTGMKLTERYELSPDADVLYRHITFRSSKREEEALTQTFDRAAR